MFLVITPVIVAVTNFTMNFDLVFRSPFLEIILVFVIPFLHVIFGVVWVLFPPLLEVIFRVFWVGFLPLDHQLGSLIVGDNPPLLV